MVLSQLPAVNVAFEFKCAVWAVCKRRHKKRVTHKRGTYILGQPARLIYQPRWSDWETHTSCECTSTYGACKQELTVGRDAANSAGDPQWWMHPQTCSTHTHTHTHAHTPTYIHTYIHRACTLSCHHHCVFPHASLIGNRSWVSGLQTRQCVIPSIPPFLPPLLGMQRSDSPSDKTGAACEQQAGAKITLWSRLSLVVEEVFTTVTEGNVAVLREIYSIRSKSSKCTWLKSEESGFFYFQT